MNIERRFSGAGVTLRARNEDELPEIVGHAAVYYDGTPATEFNLWDDMVERIAPGAFDRALQEKHDVRALKNHDANLILGRTEAGTLDLSTDKRGLVFVIDPPNTQTGRDTVTEIQRGDISGSSFAFRVLKETFEDVEDDREGRESRALTIRTIEDLELFDISPVTYPAYDGTDAGTRAEAGPIWCRSDGNVTELIQQRDAWRDSHARAATAMDTMERDARADEVLAGDDLEDRARRLGL